MPTWCLPVLSAISCSSHAPKLAMSSSARIVSLSRPAVASVPIASPSETPGFDSMSGWRHAASIVEADARSASRSMPDQRRRDEADVGQRRVAAADVGRVEEHLPNVVVMLDGIDALARVGDQREVGAGVLVDVVRDGLESRLGSGPGVGHERIGLGRRPGLRGDEDERPQRVEVVQGRGDEGRVGRVEDAQLQIALDRAERPAEDVGCEAAAAHPGDDCRREPLVIDGVAEPLEAGDLLGEVGRCVEPAETVEDAFCDARVSVQRVASRANSRVAQSSVRARSTAAA